jgi:hypothetical protein
LVGKDCFDVFSYLVLHRQAVAAGNRDQVDKALPPGYEKLKQCYETDNRLRCLTVFILEPGQSQS